MNWTILLSIFYIIILIYTVFRILLDTHSTSKTLAYLLLVFIFPIFGVIFYFSFGRNYRHPKYRYRALSVQKEVDELYKELVQNKTQIILNENPDILSHYSSLVEFQYNNMGEVLSENSFELLINGEEKFPKVLKALSEAKSFIHMEYYAWENDTRGNEIKEMLLKKAKEGVQVRVLYDDYASRSIRKNIVNELNKGGVNIYPTIKVKLKQFANRINHRDHRKVIIIDGMLGFVGGINISDRYDNTIETGLYWRDTHVKINGPLVHSLQRHFIMNWNVSQKNPLKVSKSLFPSVETSPNSKIIAFGQIMAGGPVYRLSTIMLSYFKIFNLARNKLYITNPYFIPNDSILNALKQAAISGVDVRIILPEKSDSIVVGAASKFYFSELLEAGVRIFLYKKGFVHAKTVVVDGMVSIVGTANMDIRSFDLNFEIMSIIYGNDFATELESAFFDDLEQSSEVILQQWQEISLKNKLLYAIARLISSFL